jgi:TatD DNase family protein
MQSEFFTTIKAIYGVESKPRSSATVPNLCDFDFNVFHQDLISSRDELTKIAVDNGVKWFVAPGTTLKDSEDLLTMSHSDERFFCTAGIHPYNAEKEVLSESSLSSLDSLVKRNNCLGVGECGLDFSDGFPEISYQIQWFR